MDLSILDPPKDCGKRIIPKLIDDIASSDPQRPFISVPKSIHLEDGFEDIDYGRFARAVNSCSWWMEEHLGIQGKSETIAYLGPLDVRYLLVLLAASKTGRVVKFPPAFRANSIHADLAQAFLTSHRNSLEAHLTLLDKIQCQKLLVADQAPAVTYSILAERPMMELRMPGFDFFEVNEQVENYPWKGTFNEVRDKPFVILHTSGSTGVPKPVYVTHGTFAGNDAHQMIPSLGGKPTFCDYVRNKRYFLALPVFHSANLTFTLGFNVFFGITCVLPPPVPMTVEILDQVHTYGDIHGSLLPPSLIVDIYNDPKRLANMLQRLQFVTYVGGTLPREVGNLVSSKIRLITLFGSTETKLFPIEINDSSKDWEFINISPFLGYEFRPSRDELCELVIVRRENLSLFQGVFSTFPDLQEYPMKDLYEQHSEQRSAWAFRARADDIIAFNNAEKLNPVTMETIICGHPAVKSALIGGNGQFQAALLVEPNQPLLDQKERSDFTLEIWPTVMKANRSCPAHGRIMKDFIIISSPEKPLPRAGKDTVQRYAALNLYADEFQALYGSKTQEPQAEPMSGSVETSTAPEGGASTAGLEFRDEKMELPKGSNEIPMAELDARIEAVLHRILPGALSQHLGPAIIQMAKNLLLTPALQENAQHGGEYSSGEVQNVAMKCTSTTPSVARTIRSDSKDLREGIHHAIANCTYLINLNDRANLFECGLDSLQITGLVNEINTFVQNSRPDVRQISKKTIYENPSIEKLIAAMV